jgi:hypothetical protein
MMSGQGEDAVNGNFEGIMSVLTTMTSTTSYDQLLPFNDNFIARRSDGADNMYGVLSKGEFD